MASKYINRLPPLAIRDCVWHICIRIATSKKTEHAYITKDEEKQKFLLITIVKTSDVKNRDYVIIILILL